MKEEKVDQEKSKYPNYKQFIVTFKQNKKYNAIIRNMKVHALNELHARLLVTSEFDTYKFSGDVGFVPTGKRITIIKVEEVKIKNKTT